MKHLGQPAGDDADDAGMPALASQDDRAAVAEAAVGFDHLLGFVKDLAFDFLAARVAAIELGGDRLAPAPRSSVVSSSTAIMARSSRPAALIRGASPKPTIPVVSRFLSRDPLTSIKAPKPDAGLGGDPRQAVPDHDAILVPERNHVGDGRQRDQAQRHPPGNCGGGAMRACRRRRTCRLARPA